MAAPLYKKFKSVTDADKYAQRLALDGLQNYTFSNKVEEVFEKNGDLLQEVWLANESNNEMQYAIRITELRDVQIAQYVLHEVKILQDLGIHKRIMSVFTVFRNRAYIAYVMPAYTSIRTRIIARYKFKKGEDDGYSFSNKVPSVWGSNPWVFSEIKTELQQSPGILNRNSVAFLLRKVIKGLKYLHSKGYVHTQLNTSDVYMNAYCYVKLAGFGHCRKLGSKTWKFTGNANLFAPEVVLDSDENRVIEPSFDIFGLGLLTLEVISGRNASCNNDQARQYLKGLISGAEPMPSLREYDESCYANNRCIYDDDVEDFLKKLLALDPKERATLEQAFKHPFISRKIEKAKAVEMWTTNEKPLATDDSPQTLRAEMAGAQGRESKLEVEHLCRVIYAVTLAKKEFFPIFNQVPDKKLFSNFIAIESSVATPFIENDWSREVLDISNAQIDRFEVYRKAYKIGAGIQSNDDAPDYYNRNDQIFFIDKEWPDDERQLFVALQFGRWYHQGFIEFADVVRLCSEVEDMIKDFLIESDVSNSKPKKIYWSTKLRRLIKNITLYNEPTTRSLCQVYSSIAVHPEFVERMKKKYDDLANSDPVQVVNGKTTLSLSVMFRELDLDRFKKMEDLVLGSKRVGEWEYDIKQRREDRKERSNRLRPLVRERRMNPNNYYNKHSASFADDQDQDNNQARVAKIWGAYDRDFVYKTCKVEAVDYKLTKEDATTVYGNPFEEDKIQSEMPDAIEGLEKNMMRTKLYQERDHIDEFKQHDYVEARQHAYQQKDQWDEDVRKNEGLSPGKRVRITVPKQAKRFDTDYDDSKLVYPSPAPKLGKHLRRNPKN